MFRTTLANLSRRKLRLAATSLAVLLGVMFTSGTLVLTDSLGATFNELFTNVYANTSAVVRSNHVIKGDLQVAASGSTRGTLSDSMIAKVADIDGVASASGAVQGYTQIIKRNGKALGNPNQGPPTMGSSFATDRAVSPYRVVQGRGPRTSAEFVTDISTAKAAGYRIGDHVPMLTQTGRVTKTLVGVTRFGDKSSAGGSTMSQFTLSEAQRLFGKPGQVDEIWVRANTGVTQAQVVSDIQAAKLAGTETITGAAAAQEAKDLATSFLSFITVFLLVFALIALLVGAFIIANTFSILVAQRTRELALLRAIGASARQVLASVVAEAAIVGLIASAAGLGLGFVVGTGLEALIGGSDFASSTTLSPRTIIASFVIGIGITVLSALFPARKAAKVAPVEAMRQAALEDNAHGRTRMVIGIVFAAICAVTLVAAVAAKRNVYVALGAPAGLIAAVLLGPVIAAAIARASRVLTRRSGMAGHLGVENVLRNPKRTAATASALMIGATLVCAISVFASSAVASIDNLVDTGFHGDAVITSTGNGVPLSDIDKVAKTPGVARMAAMRYGAATVDGTGMIVAASNPADLAALVDMKVSAGDLATLGNDGMAVAETEATRRHWRVGTTVKVVLLDGTAKTLTVKAIYTNPLVGRSVFASTEAIAGSLVQPVSQIAFVKADAGVDSATLVARLDRIMKSNPTATVQTNAEFKKSSAAQMDAFLNIVYAMLGLAVFIAFMGIVNTLGLSILERTRELGLLRAVGMTRRQLRKTIRIEALLISMTGTVVGLVLGTAIGAALIKSFGPNQALTGFAIPVDRLVTVLVVGVIVGLVSAILPARRATRMDPLAALATN